MESIVVRTQIQLEARQARMLKALAAQEGRSMADLIREGVDALLRGRGHRDPEDIKRRALDVVGAYRSGLGDLAEHHDRYLDETFDG